jgi:hypothetical protein
MMTRWSRRTTWQRLPRLGGVPMSWLFDQLTELAIADRVDVVVGVDVAHLPSKPGSIDVAELVERAARLPKTTLLLLPTEVEDPTLPLDGAEAVDLSTMQPTSRSQTVARMLSHHGCHCGAVLRAGEGRMSLEPYGRLPERDRIAADLTTRGTAAWMFATQDPSPIVDSIDEAPPAGLRISIGNLHPTSNVMIADATSFVSLLDALVTLREFALDPVQSSPGNGGSRASASDAG